MTKLFDPNPLGISPLQMGGGISTTISKQDEERSPTIFPKPS